jgi:hypothetical protein
MNLKPVISKFLKGNTCRLLETGGSILIVIESIHPSSLFCSIALFLMTNQ